MGAHWSQNEPPSGASDGRIHGDGDGVVVDVESRTSSAHQASDDVASRLARTVHTLPASRIIGLGGMIAAGKTTLGRALEIACKRSGVPCHFAPEVVDEGALKLYIDAQRLPDWFKTAVSSGDKTQALRYNRRFYDVAFEGSADADSADADAHPMGHGVSRTVNAHASSFQIFMLASCQHRVREASLFLRLQPNGLAVVDRTAWDNTVFEEANRCLYRSISDDDHAFYSLVRGSAPAFGVDALIYLDVTPDVTMERIRVRGSSAEASYQRTYMTYLHDIWFHRIVQNYTETRHRSLFDGSIVEEANDERKVFPIYIVPWNDFANASVEDVMQRIDNADMQMPRVRFYPFARGAPSGGGGGTSSNSGSSSSSSSSGGGGSGTSSNGVDELDGVSWTTMHWTDDYASPAVSDEQRATFKKRVVDLMSRGESILFFF